jgi:tRNA/rRNA methyltransferase
MPAGPAILLVDPQLGENIGAAARAMANGALNELRLVRPRDGWPNPKADASAVGATEVLAGVTLHESTEAAIADLTSVYATTARHRGMTKRVLTPRAAIGEIRQALAAGGRPGILFGPERTGLENDDIALADAVICVPLNPDFSSLNLAQAVMILAYEWYQAIAEAPPEQLVTNRSEPATKAALHGFFGHLEAELDDTGFFPVPEKRPSMVRNIRNVFERANLTAQEVRTLHGIVARLVGWGSGRRGSGDGGEGGDGGNGD